MSSSKNSIQDRKEWIYDESATHLEQLQRLQWDDLVRYVKHKGDDEIAKMAVGHALFQLFDATMKFEESDLGFSWIEEVRFDQPDIRFRLGSDGWEVFPEGRCKAKWTIRESDKTVFSRWYFGKDGPVEESPVGLTVSEEKCLLLVDLVGG